jgi:hypothetical protein
MKFIGKKRLLTAASAVTAMGAVATLVAGVTFGLFSASDTSGGISVTAGTVSVGAGTPTSVTCTTTNLVPGDSSSGFGSLSATETQCTYNVKYTGSEPAYLGVDIAVTNGATTLYDSTGTTGLQYLVKAGSVTYMNGTSYKDEAGASQSVVAGTPVANLLVSTTPATTNTAVSFTIDYGLLLAVTGHQGGSSTITLTFHAVQSDNQTLPAACAAGEQCNSTATFAWS